MTTKAALVTGGGTRLGRFFAERLARAGYDVAVHFHGSAEAAAEAVETIRGFGRDAERFQCDFRSGDPEQLVADVRERFPNLAVLVNSASAYTPAPIAQTSRELLEEQFSVNLFTPLLLTKAFAAAGGQGCVVNIVDNKIAYHQYPYAAYLLAKKGLAAFTRMAALEFAPAVRVNGIAPGVILPAQARTGEYLQWRFEGIPLARQGSQEHLGRALDYLLDNDFVNGQLLVVDGGESINLEGRHSENFPGRTNRG